MNRTTKGVSDAFAASQDVLTRCTIFVILIGGLMTCPVFQKAPDQPERVH
ncbi:hypothetical protein [Paracoccus alcaliphilus]|nr:hypothetical protein [Paracoccus alcaliphilus]WCR16732.1 hypothetical protein JHW40_09820 [Paracoccus alcaliphilus]